MKTSRAVKFQREQHEIGVIVGMSIIGFWIAWLV